MIWTEETARLQTAGNRSERRCWRASVAHSPHSGISRAIVGGRVGEVRRVREVDRICSELQGEPFGQLDLTSQAQVHAEKAGAAELVTVGVSEVSVRISSNKRRCEHAWVEVSATQVAQSANAAGAGVILDEVSAKNEYAGVGRENYSDLRQILQHGRHQGGERVL